QGAVVFRREAALEIPPSPPGYFMYETEPPTVIEFLARGWEADYLPAARVYHLWEARGRQIGKRSAYLPFRNDLVTIRRYYRGWRRFDLMAGRYLTGLLHLLAAGAAGEFPRALREARELLAELPVREVSDEELGRVLPCFDGLALSAFLGETNRRRAAWFLGRLPIDQAS